MAQDNLPLRPVTPEQEAQIALLIEILTAAGDPRFGGERPMGGKSRAGTVDYSKAGGMRAVRAGPVSPFVVGSPADAAAYDQFMNMKEAQLQDLLQSLGMNIGSVMRRGK